MKSTTSSEIPIPKYAKPEPIEKAELIQFPIEPDNQSNIDEKYFEKTSVMDEPKREVRRKSMP